MFKLDTTTTIAIYGAFVSTIVASVQVIGYWHARQERKPRIRVTLANDDQRPDRWLYLTGTNTGEKTVTLTRVGLLFPDGTTLADATPPMAHGFPKTLTPGSLPARVQLDKQRISQQLNQRGFHGRVKLAGYFEDAAETRYESEAIDFLCQGDKPTNANTPAPSPSGPAS